MQNFCKSKNFGAPGPKLVELLQEPESRLKPRYKRSEGVTTSKKYSVQWKEPKINVAELARLRFLEDWDLDMLAARYMRPRETIGSWCRKLRSDEFVHRTISPELQAQLSEADSKRRAHADF